MRVFREGLAVVVLLGIFGVVWFYWPQLPERIPAHYGLLGVPDAYGPKGTLWILPGAALFLYTLLTYVGRHPQRMNLPSWVTPEQRSQVLPTAQATVGWLKVEIMGIFGWMTWTTIAVALGLRSGLGAAFLPVSLGVVVLTTLRLLRVLREIKKSGTTRVML
jgi:Domain of unknown function (DUF1648)